ncbi:hypothetical protein C7E18_03600, partial [Stenotrophomonas maltophilia]
GESAWTIARRYGMPVKALLSLNGLSGSSVREAGRRAARRRTESGAAPPRPARPFLLESRAHARLFSCLRPAGAVEHGSTLRIGRHKKGPALPGLSHGCRREAYRFASVVWIMNFLRIASM